MFDCLGVALNDISGMAAARQEQNESLYCLRMRAFINSFENSTTKVMLQHLVLLLSESEIGKAPFYAEFVFGSSFKSRRNWQNPTNGATSSA
jgi:hypothetical protein